MIFVDTGAWFATAIRSDANHAAARRWFFGNREQLVTTDYVIDETLTLLTTRGHPGRARTLGQQFFSGEPADIYFLTEADAREAWQTFLRYDDKEWCFTDCTSTVVMEKLGIARAFAFDQHFRQFGSVIVVP